MDADVTVSAARPTVPARRGLRLRDAAPPLSPALASGRPHDIRSLGILLWHSLGGGLVQEMEAARCRGAGSRTLVLRILCPGEHYHRARASSRRQHKPGHRKRREGGDWSLRLRRRHAVWGWGRRGGAKSLGEGQGGASVEAFTFTTRIGTRVP